MGGTQRGRGACFARAAARDVPHVGLRRGADLLEGCAHRCQRFTRGGSVLAYGGARVRKSRRGHSFDLRGRPCARGRSVCTRFVSCTAHAPRRSTALARRNAPNPASFAASAAATSCSAPSAAAGGRARAKGRLRMGLRWRVLPRPWVAPFLHPVAQLLFHLGQRRVALARRLSEVVGDRALLSQMELHLRRGVGRAVTCARAVGTAAEALRSLYHSLSTTRHVPLTTYRSPRAARTAHVPLTSYRSPHTATLRLLPTRTCCSTRSESSSVTRAEPSGT